MPNISNIIAVLPGCGEWNPGSKPPHFACESLAKGGWAGWVKSQLIPAIDWFEAAGMRPRVLIYFPFSAQQFTGFNGVGSAFNAAALPGAFAQGFVKAIKPFSAYVGLIAYMGNLKVMTWKVGIEFVVDSVMASIRPLADANVGYIIDEGGDYPADSTEYQTIELTRHCVPFVGYEGWPLASCTNLHDKPLFFDTRVWAESQEYSQRARFQQFTGEIIRYRDVDELGGVGQPAEVAGRVVKWTRDVLTCPRPMTAAIPINDLLTAGVKAGELVAA